MKILYYIWTRLHIFKNNFMKISGFELKITRLLHGQIITKV